MKKQTLGSKYFQYLVMMACQLAEQTVSVVVQVI